MPVVISINSHKDNSFSWLNKLLPLVIFVNSLIKLHITCKRCDFSIMRSYVIFRICAIINTTCFCEYGGIQTPLRTQCNTNEYAAYGFGNLSWHTNQLHTGIKA